MSREPLAALSLGLARSPLTRRSPRVTPLHRACKRSSLSAEHYAVDCALWPYRMCTLRVPPSSTTCLVLPCTTSQVLNGCYRARRHKCCADAVPPSGLSWRARRALAIPIGLLLVTFSVKDWFIVTSGLPSF
mmetsp:Transcript_47593/g.124713  ORF Transcript_47593/g.124713 Transcript_47593/m.124713 type:complete len:132 (+) Transcript_47593:177-572(+)